MRVGVGTAEANWYTHVWYGGRKKKVYNIAWVDSDTCEFGVVLNKISAVYLVGVVKVEKVEFRQEQHLILIDYVEGQEIKPFSEKEEVTSSFSEAPPVQYSKYSL